MNILAVISNKGGVGKTSIALTAGFHYSRRLKQKTLLMELDSSPGDFGSIFDIGSDKSLEFAIRFPHNFQNYLKKIKENLYVLKGISDPFTAENIECGEILVLLEMISGNYQNIIIDTQTVLTRLIADVLRISAKIILITEYTVESISRSLYLYTSLIKKYSVEREKINLIVNKKKNPDFLRFWDFSQFTDLPINGFISYDRNFNKNFFFTDGKKIFTTKLYRQLAEIIDCGFQVKTTGDIKRKANTHRIKSRHKSTSALL